MDPHIELRLADVPIRDTGRESALGFGPSSHASHPPVSDHHNGVPMAPRNQVSLSSIAVGESEAKAEEDPGTEAEVRRIVDELLPMAPAERGARYRLMGAETRKKVIQGLTSISAGAQTGPP